MRSLMLVVLYVTARRALSNDECEKYREWQQSCLKVDQSGQKCCDIEPEGSCVDDLYGIEETKYLGGCYGKVNIAIPVMPSRAEYVKTTLIPTLRRTTRNLIPITVYASNVTTCKLLGVDIPRNVECRSTPVSLPPAEANPPYPQDSRQRFEWYWQETSDMMNALVGGNDEHHILFLEDDVIPSQKWFARVFQTIRSVTHWDVLVLYTPDFTHVQNGERGRFTSCSQAMMFHSSVTSKISKYLRSHIGSKPPDLLLSDVLENMNVRILNPSLFQHNKELRSTLIEKASASSHMSMTFVP